MLDSNSNPFENIKFFGKGKYMNKYKKLSRSASMKIYQFMMKSLAE